MVAVPSPLSCSTPAPSITPAGPSPAPAASAHSPIAAAPAPTPADADAAEVAAAPPAPAALSLVAFIVHAQPPASTEAAPPAHSTGTPDPQSCTAFAGEQGTAPHAVGHTRPAPHAAGQLRPAPHVVVQTCPGQVPPQSDPLQSPHDDDDDDDDAAVATTAAAAAKADAALPDPSLPPPPPLPPLLPCPRTLQRQLRGSLAARLPSSAWVPRHYLLLPHTLPRSPAGKVLRPVLAQWAQQQLSHEAPAAGQALRQQQQQQQQVLLPSFSIATQAPTSQAASIPAHLPLPHSATTRGPRSTSPASLQPLRTSRARALPAPTESCIMAVFVEALGEAAAGLEPTDDFFAAGELRVKCLCM